MMASSRENRGGLRGGAPEPELCLRGGFLTGTCGVGGMAVSIAASSNVLGF
jgi:hypothetical protein